jgi:hypothetical protein
MQLDRCGSFSHDPSRFYAAEVVKGIEALLAAGIMHREFQRGIAQSVPSGDPPAGGAPY